MNDQAIINAYLHTQRRFLGSVDTLLCSPDQRDYFLERCRRTLGDLSEPALLTRLVNLRKRSKLPTAPRLHSTSAGASAHPPTPLST